jgi:hypothetical protein
MATPRNGSFIWVTWIVGLLSTDDQCQYAAWFKSHFSYTKIGRTDGALAKWKAEHGAMVTARAAALKADGWTVFTEAQNKFVARGKAATLSGTPDLVAVRGQDALVVDCKSGQPRDKDYWQVCIYLMLLPLTHPAVKDCRLVGEVQYREHSLLIQPEEFTLAQREQITEQIRKTGSPTIPARTPSAKECGFCDIPKADCADRIEQAAAVEVEHALF